MKLDRKLCHKLSNIYTSMTVLSLKIPHWFSPSETNFSEKFIILYIIILSKCGFHITIKEKKVKSVVFIF